MFGRGLYPRTENLLTLVLVLRLLVISRFEVVFSGREIRTRTMLVATFNQVPIIRNLTVEDARKPGRPWA